MLKILLRKPYRHNQLANSQVPKAGEARQNIMGILEKSVTPSTS
jgi:hypothetical protein